MKKILFYFFLGGIFYLFCPKLSKAQQHCSLLIKCKVLNMNEFVRRLEIPEELDTFALTVVIMKGEDGNFYFSQKSRNLEQANTFMYRQLEEHIQVLKIVNYPGFDSSMYLFYNGSNYREKYLTNRT